MYTMAPKTAPQARFRESILMGHYTGTLLQFDAILHELRSKFGPDDYDLLTKNCNCFSESFVSLLLNKPIPGYVNRAASVGGLFRCCFDMNQPPVEQVNNGNDRTRGGSYGTNNPIYNSRSPGMPTSGGYRLGGGDASNSAVPGSTGGRGIGNKGIAARLSANNQSASDSDEKSNPSRNKATNMQPMAII